MSQIVLKNDESRPYTVYETIRPGRVIVQYGGLFVFADLDTMRGWWVSSAIPTEEENIKLHAVIQENGGFDNTTVDVEPPDGAA